MWVAVRSGVMAILLVTHAEAQKDALLDDQAAAREHKGVYGTDDRTDETRAAACVGEACEGAISAPLRAVGSASTVALIPRSRLSYDARTNSWVPRSSMTLGEAFNMCPADSTTGTATRFVNQPTPASCSGTVVQWDPSTKTGLVASAAHCFDEDGDTNGCQNSEGDLIGVPQRLVDCEVRGACLWVLPSVPLLEPYVCCDRPDSHCVPQYAGDGICDEGLDGSAAFCPVGSDSADCGEREEAVSQCPFLFVFDFTDESVQAGPAPAPPVQDDCRWAADGECDSPRYCPANSDLCDCSGINCPEPPQPTFAIPAANVYDCQEVVMCDIESLRNDWAVGGDDGSFTDFALTRIVAAGISSYAATCAWEDDGECDVPTYCPAGTDTVDCRSQDTAALRAARTTDYSHLTRVDLDGGNPRSITPATMYAGVLAPGSPLTVIGHPSGLPRKYTGGATVQDVAECQMETLCPAGDAAWAAYTADLDTFGGNSGSGTFTDSGEMVGILISGATDFYHRVGNHGGASACMEFARCEDGINFGHCRWYDLSVRFPAACQTDATSMSCYRVCEGPGLEWVSCGGENVAPTAGLITYIQRYPSLYPAGTFTVVDSTAAPVQPAPDPELEPESVIDLLTDICPAQVGACLASTICLVELIAMIETDAEEVPADGSAELLSLVDCVVQDEGQLPEPEGGEELSVIDMLFEICPAEVSTCLEAATCETQLNAAIESEEDELPADASDELLQLVACIESGWEVWDGEGDNPDWDSGWGGCDTYAADQPNYVFCLLDGADVECPVACTGAIPLVDTLDSVCPSELAACQQSSECSTELESWLDTTWSEPSESSEAMVAVQNCFYDLVEHDSTALAVLTQYCPDEVAGCLDITACGEELELAIASGEFVAPVDASAALQAVATCFQQPCSGGIPLLDSGTLAHGNLAEYQECEWQLTCSDSSLAPTLTFTEFHTEAHYDFLHVYDSLEGSGNNFALHGTTIPEPLAVSGSSAIVVYSSDGSVNGNGFRAEFSCGTPAPLDVNDGPCSDAGVTLTDSGTVAHTAESIDHNQLCNWELQCSNAEHVPQLQFSAFHTETWYDVVVLYDGQSSAELNYLHGSLETTQRTYEGVTSSMRVTYSSDGSVSGDGFDALFTCQEPTDVASDADPCTTGVTLTDSGIISHTNLGNHDECTWVMECSDAETVPQLTVTTLHTESDWDYLYVFDSPDSSGPAHRLHGTEAPAEPIITSQSGAFVHYASDGSLNGEGIEAQFECVPLPPGVYSDDPCQEDGVLLIDSAAIDFVPEGNDQDCHWTVECSDATQVPVLTFTSFQTEANFDYVYLYDSASATGESVAFHGTDVPDDPLAASGPAGHVRYVSDYSVNGDGFQASFQCATGGPPGGPSLVDAAGLEDHERACSGGVEVGAGDSVELPSYAADASCSWTIACPFAPVVLTFTDLDIEQGWDFIHLYDGEDSAAASIGDPISGQQSDGWPGPQASSGVTMFVQFTSDGSVERPGFAAYASCPNQEATFCGVDERVVSHMCTHCDPGKENTAGDDASGTDTSCYPIVCGVNERVADNVCVSCESGKQRAAGDDASSRDTECTLIPTTGMCVGNTISTQDIACPEDEGLMEKPDPETIACGASCSTRTCCDALPQTPPEVWYLWEATAFESCPAMTCGARVVTRSVRCIKVSIFSTGSVQRENEALAAGETSGCEEAERPSTTQACRNLDVGTRCDDRNPDTTNDVCTSDGDDAQCQGTVALVSAVTFNIPVESLDIPDESASAEDVDASPVALAVKTSLKPVLARSFGVRLTADSITVLRIRAGSLEVDYKVDLPPAAATEEAQDAAVAAIADPAAAGLRPDAMDLSLTDTTGRQVVSNGALPQPFHTFSYVWANTCPAGQQPGVDSSGCPSACGRSEVTARDSWRCLRDGSAVHSSLCEENGLGMLPLTFTQCCPAPEDGTCVGSDADEVEAARLRQCDKLEGLEERLVCRYGEENVKAAVAAFVFTVVLLILGIACCLVLCVCCCVRKRRRDVAKATAQGGHRNAREEAPPEMPEENPYTAAAATVVVQQVAQPQLQGVPVVVAVPMDKGGAGPPPEFGEAPPAMPPAENPSRYHM